jgi:hypothetical protein
MAESQRLLAGAVERLNAHDREIRDLKRHDHKGGESKGDGASRGAMTWREARIVGTTVSMTLSLLYGAFKAIEWAVHTLRTP